MATDPGWKHLEILGGNIRQALDSFSGGHRQEGLEKVCPARPREVKVLCFLLEVLNPH